MYLNLWKKQCTTNFYHLELILFIVQSQKNCSQLITVSVFDGFECVVACDPQKKIIFSVMSRQFVLHAKMSCPSNLEGGSTPVGRTPLPATLRTRLTPRERKWEEEDGKEGKEAEFFYQHLFRICMDKFN